MFQLTPVVRNLIIITVIVFLLQQFIPALDYLLALYDLKSGYFRPYQFFTYMFAHGDFMHIFFNLLAFASIAPILESTWGDKKFLFFYLATGIGAGAIYILADYFLFPGSAGRMVGASGALYGVLMAFGLVFPNMEIRLFFGAIPVKAKYLVFILGFLTYMMDRSGKVAHIAHFGGAFIGLIILNVWKSQGNRRGW
jgi:membrane associated rhomboid family serine protease